MSDNKSYLQEYYDKLVAHKLETQKEYQKVILAISGGSLTVSLTFSDNVVSQTGGPLKYILVLGWLFLLICILAQIIYYLNVTKSTTELIEKIEPFIDGKQDNNLDYINETYKNKIQILELNNRIALISLFVGLILVSFFFTINILKKSNDSITTINSLKKSLESPAIHIENNPVFNNTNSQTIDTISTIIIK